MILDREMVSATELAFIADVNDRDVNRLVDERILPDFLFKTENGRRFDRSAAVFARFYFDAQYVLTAEARKSVINDLAWRIKDDPVWTFAECKTYPRKKSVKSRIDLQVTFQLVKIDLNPLFAVVWERATDAARASATIASDPEILGGEPVFAGTRVPIDSVLGSLDEGVTVKRLQTSWPFLNESLIDDARLYMKLHPRRGRPRGRSADADGWKLRSRKVILSGTGGA